MIACCEMKSSVPCGKVIKSKSHLTEIALFGLRSVQLCVVCVYTDPKH